MGLAVTIPASSLARNNTNAQIVVGCFPSLRNGTAACSCFFVMQYIEQELARVPAHVARRNSKQLWSVLYIPQVCTADSTRRLCSARMSPAQVSINQSMLHL
jgi:hypothetical protein